MFCGTCPLPAPTADLVPEENGIAIALCTDGPDIAVYLYNDVPVAGFQFSLTCFGEPLDDIVPDANSGTAIALGFQVSSGTAGTVVGVSLDGMTSS
mgnify:CR=1 FL=1